MIMETNFHFKISKGDKQYVAEGVELAIVTQAKTYAKLIKNIQEATDLHLEAMMA
jgi:predicted RNase H-like HicB family nuclease